MAIAGLYVVARSELGQRLVFDHTITDSSLVFRTQLLETVIRDFGGITKVFGLGLGGFSQWFESQTGLAQVAPHFEWVWVWTEGGGVGSLIYVMCMAVAAARISLTYRRSRDFERRGFLILLLLAPIGPLHLSNPTYFYQAMIPWAAALGASLQGKDMVQVSGSKETRRNIRS